MAEVSTVTPSPPGLGDAHINTSLANSSDLQPPPDTSDYPKHPSVLKSGLYNDPTLLAPPVSETELQSNGKGSSSVLPNSTPQESALEGAVTSPAECSEEQKEWPMGEEMATGVVSPTVLGQEAQCTQEGPLVMAFCQPDSVADRQGLSEQNCPFPSVNPHPNLYPDVVENQNSCPIGEPQPLCPPAASADLLLPSDNTLNATATPAIVHNSPETQDGDNLKQIPDCQTKSSPKQDLPSSPKIVEPSVTPKIQHFPPVPSIHESPATLSLPNTHQRPAPDTLSYLESASLMSGTLESLSGLGEDCSSLGSDSEVSGLVFRRTDKYGFLGGSQYSEGSERSDIQVDVARQREMKWLEMFNNWDKWVSRRFQKVKLRCRKGIPSSLRAKAWQLLSNSEELLDANPGKFEELDREQGDHKWLDIIEKDLHRQFPFHEMFAARGGHGQQDLYRILKAYTVYRPEEGYCQAQAPVAAVLLMHMPAEQAFWCLVQICEKYLPGYYSAGLEAIQLDGEIFFSILRRVCPMAYRHLKKFKIDPILYMTEWFMCIFSRSLPWGCVLRVWDMFFCEGVKVVFRVGLVLLKQMLGSVEKLRELQGMYETMERLRNIPLDNLREELLVQEVISLGVTEALIERESSVQVQKWRQSRGELTHQPGRRMHGTRALNELKLCSSSVSRQGSFSFLGGPAPSPGPLRASSSLLSLPGFRRSKTASFRSQYKPGSFSGGSASERAATQVPQGPSSAAAPSYKPHSATGPADGPSQRPASPPQGEDAASAHAQPAPQNPTPSCTHSPSPSAAPEQRTTGKPPARAGPGREPGAARGGEEEGKKQKRSKDEKKREKEEEKARAREQKEREKAERERQKKEKKKEKGGKKGRDGAEAEKKSGAKPPREAKDQAPGQSSSH
ncbi:hypothetical protein COCON_G00031640 [Conger conger]|uniref:Rab-GAP TBC domain-containing protein n=1 Tax=Conger conger TaxID=82655 RepID=A0A9Q1DYY3_CONCO|nr:TBC1 domain family member 10A-like [Conger conger]XP_061087353.1 TBC1 domain family member 10A-like [Conger conger]XP_061087354.1 TBC1 domain family member 10A-like [Conger conger]KAJ8284314.1 hypothetical protein COCON_G00031640 [Conger conger]